MAPRLGTRCQAGVYLCVFGVCLALFGVNAVLQGLAAASAARADALAAEYDAIQRELAEIELDIAYLSSSPRIAREAVTNLAMRPPNPGDYRFPLPEQPAVRHYAARPAPPSRAGLVASLGDWLRSFGRAAAAD
ncbi:MAG: hypothetical protein ACM3XS_02525 [Bacteroidota bacterium]